MGGEHVEHAFAPAADRHLGAGTWSPASIFSPVTVSGFDQETYEINHHVDGVWAYVVRNLHAVRDIIARRQLPTTWVELAHAQIQLQHAPRRSRFVSSPNRWASGFEPIAGIGDPRSDYLKAYTSEHFVRDAENASGNSFARGRGQGVRADVQSDRDRLLKGDVYVCSGAVPIYPYLKLGKFLDMTADQILAKKFTHPFCRACTMPRRDRATAAEDARLRAALQEHPPACNPSRCCEAFERYDAPRDLAVSSDALKLVPLIKPAAVAAEHDAGVAAEDRRCGARPVRGSPMALCRGGKGVIRIEECILVIDRHADRRRMRDQGKSACG